MKTDIEMMYYEILEQGAEQFFSSSMLRLRDHIVIYADKDLKIALHAIKGYDRFNGYLEGPKWLLNKYWSKAPHEITWCKENEVGDDMPADRLPQDLPKQFENTGVIGWDYSRIQYIGDGDWNNLSRVVSDGFKLIFPIYGLEFPRYSSNCIFSP